MKKRLTLALIFAAVVLNSCGRSSWKCTNRYCKTEKPAIKPAEIKKKTTVVAS